MKIQKITAILFVLIFIVVTGCREESVIDENPAQENLTDEETIRQDIDNEYASLFSMDVVEEEEESSEYDPSENDCINDTIPLWFRRVHKTSRDIQIHIEDGIANVAINTEIEGNFMIDIDYDHLFGEKAIQDIAVRYAVFEKNPIDKISPSGKRWKLVSISPVQIQLQDEEKRTISILEVKAAVDSETRLLLNDATKMFAVPSELSHFSPEEEVVLTAKIENLNDDETEGDSLVYLHHSQRLRRPGMGNHKCRRHLLYDDGVNGGDEIAGDNIFTGTFIIPDITGYHRAAIDVLDAEMFEDETTQNYNSMAWAMPYIVE